jgi:hypothetical protein
MKELLKAVQIAVLMSVFISPVFACAQEARSQPSDDAQPISYGNEGVDAKFVGISGGAIAGAEIVVAVEALFGVKELWPYLTFPLLGVAGGGVGGYFLEDASPKGAVALLVGGMALIIPTAILASSARAYNPEEEGAVGSDIEGGGEFSFELAPTGGEKEGASTEVESRPEGAPTDTVLPPGAEKPRDEKGAEPEPESETEPSEDSPDDEAAPEGGVQARREAAVQRNSARRSARLARIRRASAGSLFYMNNDGTAAISVPLVDVRPLRVSSEDAFFKTRQAIEVFVPLFRMDLP